MSKLLAMQVLTTKCPYCHREVDSMIEHNDVRNIQLEQSLVQRLLKVGAVGISSSGQDKFEVFAKRLSHPEQIIDCIHKNQT